MTLVQDHLPAIDARPAGRPPASVTIPLRVASAIETRASQPVTAGIPFPRGLLYDAESASLFDSRDQMVLSQLTPLARWPDGSVKWLLLDFVLAEASIPMTGWSVQLSPPSRKPAGLRIHELKDEVQVGTGAAVFRLDPSGSLIQSVRMGGHELLQPRGCRLVLADCAEQACDFRVERWSWEARGPVRATLRIEGRFPHAGCRLVARLCWFAGTGLVRLRLTLHNPNRARHRGGLWDLGDPGSIFFRAFFAEIELSGSEAPVIRRQAEPDQPAAEQTGGELEVYQDSSGGENWQSRNHVTRLGKVPCAFRGYRLRDPQGESSGLRASPIASLQSEHGTVSAALPEFWQQFPKAMGVSGRCLRVDLFPRQFKDAFELQGGEQKTHTLWLDFAAPTDEPTARLAWVHSPAHAQTPPAWYAESGALPYFLPAGRESHAPLEAYLGEAIGGPRSLFARREVIDEYGWRHFGEIHADHEEEHYTGPKPIVSHYNNQYDVVLNSLVQSLRTWDYATSWWNLGDALARHVTDIDIYHTDRDRPAYNGGLFWITDHYKDAGTATHRTFSRINCPRAPSPFPLPRGGEGRVRGASYGGGPGCEHNFTTGLLHYYYLTGDTQAREAVLGLADWVIAMDDGRLNLLGVLDDGPTGLASRTRYDHYHGPGRGVGNSINALLDGWLLTGQDRYLHKAEELVRRAVHPADNVAARDLLNAEDRWSATIFFSVLDRYLTLKAESDQRDFMYAYGRAAFLHYAAWLVEHERPYYDHPERLEFPTETWAAQELRKANVLRLAARYADEPLRTRLLERGRQLADRGWQDLMRFESRDSARAIALVLAEGPRDAFFRAREADAMPRPANAHDVAQNVAQDFGTPQGFVPQRERVRRQIRQPLGLAVALLRLANPVRWGRFLRSRR